MKRPKRAVSGPSVVPGKAEGSDLTSQQYSRFAQQWRLMLERASSGDLGAIGCIVRASIGATELIEELLARIDVTEIELLDREALKNIESHLLEQLDQGGKSNRNAVALSKLVFPCK